MSGFTSAGFGDRLNSRAAAVARRMARLRDRGLADPIGDGQVIEGADSSSPMRPPATHSVTETRPDGTIITTYVNPPAQPKRLPSQRQPKPDKQNEPSAKPAPKRADEAPDRWSRFGTHAD